MSGKKRYDALKCAVAEKLRMVPGGSFGDSGAA
jgi:hypothetical protein